MKIQDTTGRTMLVDLVYNHPRMGWLKPPQTRLHNTVGSKGVRGTIHSRVPHGRYAIRICSQTGADAIVFDNGEKLVQTSVGPRTQIIELDDQRNFLEFRAPGDTAPRAQALDLTANNADESAATTDGAQGDAGAGEEKVPYIGPYAPDGHGLVYVVVRFAKENSPFGEPPQEEFELAFQLREPDAHDEFYAQNMHLVEQAEPILNAMDPLSFQPADDASRPHVHCHFSGCKH
jgi:hypothetical protein